MSDVFGEVAAKIEVNKTPEEERLGKINSILGDLRGSSVVGLVQDTVVQSVGYSAPSLVQETLDITQADSYTPPSGEDIQGKLDEALDTIQGLMEELDSKDNVEMELSKSKAQIRDLEAQLEYLSGTAKNYMEKSNSMEYDASRTQVPTALMSFVKYYKDSTGTDDFSKESKRLMQSEVIRLTEQITGKPLTSYISDLRAFGSAPIEGTMASMGVDIQPSKTEKSQQQMLQNLF